MTRGPASAVTLIAAAIVVGVGLGPARAAGAAIGVRAATSGTSTAAAVVSVTSTILSSADSCHFRVLIDNCCHRGTHFRRLCTQVNFVCGLEHFVVCVFVKLHVCDLGPHGHGELHGPQGPDHVGAAAAAELD